MRRLLEEMDGANSDVQALRRQLNHMFPIETDPECAAQEAASNTVSPG